jgi:hypothetical protein
MGIDNARISEFRPRIDAAGQIAGTEVFIECDGRHFYTRLNFAILNTPNERAHQLLAFRQRQHRVAQQEG